MSARGGDEPRAGTGPIIAAGDEVLAPTLDDAALGGVGGIRRGSVGGLRRPAVACRGRVVRLLRRARRTSRGRRHDAATETESVVVSYTAGGFLGELNLLTGQRPYLTARVTESGRVLRIPRMTFRTLMSAKPDIADLIFNALTARREVLRATDAARAIRIVGSRYSAQSHGAAGVRHAFPSAARVDRPRGTNDPEVLLASMGLRPIDAPAVITPTGVLRHPTRGSSPSTSGSRSGASPVRSSISS